MRASPLNMDIWAASIPGKHNPAESVKKEPP